MEKNFDNFSIPQAMQFADTPAGKQLLALLQQADSSAMQAAANAAASGNMNAAKDALAPLLESEEIAKLLRQLGG